MASRKKAEKSQKILDTLKLNIDTFRRLFNQEEDDLTRQNLLRSMILFSCSGIDAVVKQLILETLDSVIERDIGAQNQLKSFVAKKIKKNSDTNYSLIAEILVTKNSRAFLIDMLKSELSFDSLQSSDQLYKVAGFFNIPTNRIIRENDKEILKRVFDTRNKIVHQMDLNLEDDEIESCVHDINTVEVFYNTIVTVSTSFINEVNEKLNMKMTNDYLPIITIEDGVLSFNV